SSDVCSSDLKDASFFFIAKPLDKLSPLPNAPLRGRKAVPVFCYILPSFCKGRDLFAAAESPGQIPAHCGNLPADRLFHRRSDPHCPGSGKPPPAALLPSLPSKPPTILLCGMEKRKHLRLHKQPGHRFDSPAA